MKKYTYKNKENGIKIQTDKRLNDPKFVLVSEVRSGMIKSNKVITK